ncbi:MAG: hypothetical protein BRC58_02670 [Cyanobacteria bacterium QS_8_64_29]|nr:MAG: hypothetical protein BRC58_02670 [Cyanobacteria bacterium QS_8_64_29]
MDSERSRSQPLAEVPLERRVYAFAIDFAAVALLAGAAAIPLLQVLVFAAAWLGLRVYAVLRYRGQSLGRWAFNLKVIDGRRGTLPDSGILLQREGLTGVGALLAAIGLTQLPNPIGFGIPCIPLAADLLFAFASEQRGQTFHDSYTRTTIVWAERGYSLDERLKRWVDEARNRLGR